MSARKISELTHAAGLADLRTQAAHNAELATTLQAALPEWLASDNLDHSLQDNGVLVVTAPGGQLRQLRQILPMLRERLRPYGIRRVVISHN